jgi:gliding motility-associated-like protein
MKNLLYSITLLSLFGIQHSLNAQCEATATASSYEIYCGQSVDLTGFGQSSGTVILDENFDGGSFGTGWGSTPGATNFSNPCSPGGVDGTPHAWMDANTSVPRTLVSSPYDLSASTAGVTICFDMLFAEQGGASPCEGPDEPDEGVFLEYSIDGGATWITINYFDPNGGNDPQLTNWNNWCYQIPAAAITASTQFRWHQTADSGADYDHWGIDNVAIYQNDINAELEWSHDGYSYGVGNPGGVNPNSVSPTSTTTYTVQLTTGSGTVCTDDVTIVVVDPNFDVNLTAVPNPICAGDCAQITGNADVVFDPGGPVTYENNEAASIIGTPATPAVPILGIPAQDGDVTSDMNINVTGVNQPTVSTNLITSVCINFYTILPFGSVDLNDLEIVLECPDGTTIQLVNVGDLTGGTINNMCFELGGPPISSGSSPYSGSFAPAESWANLSGCSSNGVWNMTIRGDITDFSIPLGGLDGWLINFDNPPDIQPSNYSWSPSASLSDASIANPEACPTTTTTYTFEMSSNVAACATYTEDITITVSPCTGCTPPVLTINNLDICSPNSADLNNGIDASSDPATNTFYNSQADANNAVNAIGANVTTSGSYWVRAEDPSDATCFDVFEIIVNITTVSYTAAITDENCGASDGEFVFTPSGGLAPYTYSIDNGTTTQGTGTFSGLAAGNYTIVIEDDNGCQVTGSENIGGSSNEDPSFTFLDFCEGSTNGPAITGDTGGTFAFNPVPTNGATINAVTGEISNEVNGATYTIEYTTGGTCPESSTQTVTVSGISFTSGITDENCGAVDGEIILTPSGGTAPYSYSIDNGTTSQANGTFSGISAGVYTIEITDDNGCTTTGTANVANIGGPSIDQLLTTNPSCNGLCDGEIEVIVSGGTVPYTYTWFDNNGIPIGNNSATITGLCAGDYSVEIADAAGSSTVLNTNSSFENGSGSCSCPTDYTCDNDASIVTNGLDPVYTVGDMGCINGSGFNSSLGANSGTSYVHFYAGADEITTNNITFIGGEQVEICVFYSGPQGAGPSGQNTANSHFSIAVDGAQVSPDVLVPTNTPWTQYCFTVTMTAGNHTFSILSGGAAQYAIWFDDFTITETSGTGCPVSSMVNLTDPPLVDASFTLTDFCEGGTNAASNIVNAGGTFSFNPAVADGATINAATGEISNGIGGTTYAVEYETPGACPQTAIVSVTVTLAPTFTLTSTNPSCGNTDGEITLTGLNPNSNYNVSYDDGATVGPVAIISDATGTIILSGLSQGNYTDFEVEANGCASTDNSILTLVDPGAPNVTTPNAIAICIGESVTLTANNPDNALLSWDNGVADGVAFTLNTAGTYTYTVTADLNGCTSTDQVIVTVNALPSVDAGNDQFVCEGDNLTLSGAGAQSYSWDNGINNGTPFVPSATTLYTVTGTDVNGCVNTDQIQITVNPIPTPSFTGDELTGCEPHTVNFSNNNTLTGATCTWNFGDGSTGVGCSGISHTYASSGVYDVTLTVTDAQGCSGSFTENNYIEVTSPPEASFTADPMVTGTNDPEVNFTNESFNGVDYIWDFGDNSPFVNTFNATHTFPDDQKGDYVVTLIASNGPNCNDTAKLVIKVEEELIFYVPNTFTPDNSGFNDFFQPIFTSGFDPQNFKLLIFNRWGEVIFESNDASIGWDGTYGGKLVQDGTYIWKIEFLVNSSDERITEHGHVNLIK